MWDFRQTRWLNYFGWWPSAIEDRKKRKIVMWYGIIFYIYDYVQLIPELYDLYLRLSENNFVGTIINLITTTLGALTFLKITIVLLRHNEFQLLIDDLKNLSDYAKEYLQEEFTVESKKRENRCKKLLIVLAMGFFTISHWVLRPIIRACLYKEKTFIYEAWSPIPNDTWNGWFAIFVLQSTHASSCVLGLFIFDSLFISMLEVMLGHIELLKKGLNNFKFEKKLQQKYTEKIIPLDYLILYHQKLVIIFEKLRKLTFEVLLGQCVSAVLILCFAVFELTLLHITSMNRFLNLIEIVFIFIALTFLYCLFGNEITFQFNEISMAAYMNDWYNGTAMEKKKLLPMMTMPMKPFILGAIINMNLDTFINVIKTAFSYYNFLTAFNERI